MRPTRLRVDQGSNAGTASVTMNSISSLNTLSPQNAGPNLASVINSGVRMHLYTGDADFDINAAGVEAMLDAFQSQYTSLNGRTSSSPIGQ